MKRTITSLSFCFIAACTLSATSFTTDTSGAWSSTYTWLADGAQAEYAPGTEEASAASDSVSISQSVYLESTELYPIASLDIASTLIVYESNISSLSRVNVWGSPTSKAYLEVSGASSVEALTSAFNNANVCIYDGATYSLSGDMSIFDSTVDFMGSGTSFKLGNQNLVLKDSTVNFSDGATLDAGGRDWIKFADGWESAKSEVVFNGSSISNFVGNKTIYLAANANVTFKNTNFSGLFQTGDRLSDASLNFDNVTIDYINGETTSNANFVWAFDLKVESGKTFSMNFKNSTQADVADKGIYFDSSSDNAEGNGGSVELNISDSSSLKTSSNILFSTKLGAMNITNGSSIQANNITYSSTGELAVSVSGSSSFICNDNTIFDASTGKVTFTVSDASKFSTNHIRLNEGSNATIRLSALKNGNFVVQNDLILSNSAKIEIDFSNENAWSADNTAAMITVGNTYVNGEEIEIVLDFSSVLLQENTPCDFAVISGGNTDRILESMFTILGDDNNLLSMVHRDNTWFASVVVVPEPASCAAAAAILALTLAFAAKRRRG